MSEEVGHFVSLGGGDEIGRSCYLVALGGAVLLLDAGIKVGAAEDDQLPRFWTPLPILSAGLFASIDLIVISHAHLDHVGCLPYVAGRARRARILMTAPTKRIAEVMLLDAARHQPQGDDSASGLYTEDDVYETMRRVETTGYHTPYALSGTDLEVELVPSGHVLGSCSVVIRSSEGTLFYTGDICVHNQEWVPGAVIPDEPIHWLALETTYGSLNENLLVPRQMQAHALVQRIGEAVGSGGSALVPAFAVGRGQEVISILGKAARSGELGSAAIAADGLLSQVCDEYRRCEEESTGDSDILAQATESARLRLDPEEVLDRADCVVASSGMLLSGTRSSRYAALLADDPRNAICLSGFVDEESPGGALRRTGDSLKVNGSRVQVRCRVGSFHLSAHATRAELLDTVRRTAPEAVLLVHGNSHDCFTQYVADHLGATFTSDCVVSAANGRCIGLCRQTKLPLGSHTGRWRRPQDALWSALRTHALAADEQMEQWDLPRRLSGYTGGSDA